MEIDVQNPVVKLDKMLSSDLSGSSDTGIVKSSTTTSKATNSKESLRLKVLTVSQSNESRKLTLTAINLANQTSTIDKGKQPNVFNVILEGVWTQNNNSKIISENTILHLLNPIYEHSTNSYLVNNSQGFLIIEPDNLLTCTFVASSLFCERKTWLNHVFLGQVGTNRAMLVGTLVHEVFQHGVKNKIVQLDKLIEHLDDLLDDATVMLEIYSVEMHMKDIRAEAISYLSSVKEFIEKYMLAGPRYPLTNAEHLEVKLLAIQDIEENVWSTKYGLKGKIDVTGSVRVYNKNDRTLVDRTIPLELKTGNPNLSSSHSAQVSLYSMMIEDRYAETNQGFVIYLKDKASMYNVPLNHNIKRDLIQRRNIINYSMKNYFLGPEMIDQPRMCKNCDRLTECILMSQLYSPGKLERDYTTMKDLLGDAIGHLDDKFMKFFQTYHEKLVVTLSTKSSSTKQAASASFWTQTSDEAEANGRGFGNLQAILPSDKSSPFITFKRHPNYKFTKPRDRDIIEIDIDDEQDNDSKSLSGSQKSISDQSRPTIKKQKIFDYFKPAQTNTTTTNSNNNQHKVTGGGHNSQSPKKLKPFDTSFNFSHCRVAISLDNNNQEANGNKQTQGSHLDSQNSSTAIAIGFVNELKEDYFTMKLYEGSLNALKPDLMYRVDKIEKKVQVDIERINLVRLLTKEDWRSDRVRSLILDKDFKPTRNAKLNHFVLTSGFDEISELDGDLQKFVVEAASTDNYYILTENQLSKSPKSKVNKSVTVLAKVLNTLDRSLLIVAQNIDHLVDLMKLLQAKKMKFILIDDGKSTRARNQFASNLVKVPQVSGLDLNKKFDAYIRQHELASVVITSYAMSIGGLLFTRRTFDYCVAYDCDKTELLVGLSPMFCSDRYILLDVREDADQKSGLDLNNMSIGNHLRQLRLLDEA